MCASLLPFALVPKLCQQLKDQLLLEEHSAQVDAGRRLLKSAKEEILNFLGTQDFWAAVPRVSEGLRTKIRERFREVIAEGLRVERVEQVELVHQLSPSVQGQLLSWVDQAISVFSRAAQVTARELETLYRELHKAEDRLRRVPADGVLRPLIEELHGLHRELAEVGKLALIKDEEIRVANFKLRELQGRYNKAVEVVAAEATRSSRIQLIARTQRVLDQYKSALIEKRIRQLQDTVSECFNMLCRKKDTLRKIVIDSRDFSVTLYDKQQRPLPKAQLSAGEKQIYAVSVLWALGRTSGRPLPIIIDTPLARLDSDHRKLLIREYFPRASHQVLILSTDTEVDQSYFAELRGSVSHAYRLEFDPAESGTKIMQGYFWKGSNEAD